MFHDHRITQWRKGAVSAAKKYGTKRTFLETPYKCTVTKQPFEPKLHRTLARFVLYTSGPLLYGEVLLYLATFSIFFGRMVQNLKVTVLGHMAYNHSSDKGLIATLVWISASCKSAADSGAFKMHFRNDLGPIPPLLMGNYKKRRQPAKRGQIITEQEPTWQEHRRSTGLSNKCSWVLH